MKRAILLILFSILIFALISFDTSFSKDNIYEDYFMVREQKLISFDLENAEMTDVLKMFSQETGLNFISTEAVKGRVLTLYIEDVPLEKAMDLIFEANNLSYDYFPESNIFVVKEMGKPTIDVITKVYTLKYARLQSSKLEAELSDRLGSCGGGAEGGGGITTAVENVLSEMGRLSVDAITNSLIVVDVPVRFPLIDEIVAKLDVPVPKIMIEVEMLDVSKTATEDLGVAWPEILASLDVTGKRFTNFPFSGSLANTQSRVFDTITTSGGHTITGASGNKFVPSVFTAIGANLALDFLKTKNDTKFLARPKILTLSNQTAEIKITTDEAISVSRTEDAESQEVTYDIERTETGTNLRVTPQVDSDTEEITLFVEIVVKDTSDSTFVISESSYISGTIRNPEERTTRTVVRLKNGETLFMGGLIKNKTTDINTNVPLFSKIPFFGALFRHKDKDITERELLIFLTPHIIKEKSCLAKKVKSSTREQETSSREDSITLALDKLGK